MIDSHCHLADDAFVSDLEAVVERARAARVEGALSIVDLTNPAEVERARSVVELWPAVRLAVGVHPHQAARYTGRETEVEPTLRRAVDGLEAARAIGEIGLDYHYDFAPPDVQQQVFRRQVGLAREIGWPVVIHTREADEDTLDILREEGKKEIRGVFHCFTGDTELARRALDLGFHVSFSGIVTFRRAAEIRAAAAVVPAERLLVETDCPYLAPVPHRGKRNEPAWVACVVDVLSEVRGQAPDEVAALTTAAFKSLFRP